MQMKKREMDMLMYSSKIYQCIQDDVELEGSGYDFKDC